MAAPWTPLFLVVLLLPGAGPAGPPPGWPWGADDAGGPPSPQSPKEPRCGREHPGAPCPPRPRRLRLRLDVSDSPEFPPAPGPRAVPAGARVFVQVSLSGAAPGLGFSLRLCFVSPRSAPAPPSAFVVVRGGCAAAAAGAEAALAAAVARRGGARQRLSFRLRPRYREPLQFLHCRLALCRRRGAPPRSALPPCRPEPCPPPARDGAAAEAEAEAELGAGGGRWLRTVSRPIVVTLGPAAAPGAPPGPVPAPLPGLRRPELPPAQQRPPPPAAPPVPPAAVAAVAFGAFVVGAALAGGLWLVHVRTAPRIPPVPPGPGAAPRPRGSQPRTPDPKQPAGGTATPPAKA